MALRDGFGAPVSHHNQEDVDALTAAARLMLEYRPDPIEAMRQVMMNSPGFIMGHCFLAGINLVNSDRRKQARLAAQYRCLKQLASKADERELGHITAIGQWLSGDYYAASQTYANILLDCPRDMIALQLGHQTDFLLGLTSSTRDRPARVLAHWSPDDPDYSYLLGMHAFGLEEAGHYAEAEDKAIECVSLNPKDNWGIHALAHCYEMQGKTGDGTAFMARLEPSWGDGNYLGIHNRWHSLLYRLERGELDGLLDIHDTHMKVTAASELMDMHDSAALLWRLGILGVDVGNRWQPLAERYSEVIDQGYMPFTDMHAMMAFVSAGCRREADALLHRLEAAAVGDSTSALTIRTAGLDIARGLHALGKGNYQMAKEILLNTRHRAYVIGGSVAQRDILNWTIIEAASRTGDRATVDGLIAERSALKPASPLTDLMRQRVS